MSFSSAIVVSASSGYAKPKEIITTTDGNLIEGTYNVKLPRGDVVLTLPKASDRQRTIRVNLLDVVERGRKVVVVPSLGGDQIFTDVGAYQYFMKYTGQVVEFIETEVVGWKAIVVSYGERPDPRIGEFFFNSVKKRDIPGIIEVVPGTITNGKLLYPIWSKMYPNFVNGNDIVFPSYVKDIFLRNTKDGTMGYENYKTALPTTRSFTTSSSSTNIFSSTNSSGSNNYMLPVYGGRSWQISGVNLNPKFSGKVDEKLDDMYINASATHTHTINSGGDDETSPKNLRLRLYTIVDTYNRN